MKIILASSSPRRKKLLEELGLAFEVVPSDVDESGIQERDFGKYVKILSRRKAESIAAQYNDALIIAADTIVVLDNEIFGKPADEDDARGMLTKLSGKTHEVYSGVCIISPQKTMSDYSVTEVTFKKLLDPEIEEYIQSGEWRDKAGGYAIQEGLSREFIASYKGSYNTVVGLPVEKLIPMLKEYGIVV